MKGTELYLVVYDISNDKRRTKLHKKLLDFGSPVQYSVFECLLDAKHRMKMDNAISKIIRPRKDAVRIYFICDECAKKVIVTCGKEVLKDTNEPLVVG